MCKLMIATGIELDLSTGSGYTFVRAATAGLTEYETHGFGYAALGSKGQFFGERWLNVKQAWQNVKITVPNALKPIETALHGIQTVSTYSSYGTPDLTDVKTLMLHARTSTNTISIQNTHPFVDEGVALIHNGMIQNASPKLMKTSTCDSEVILTMYNYYDVLKETRNIQFLTDDLIGWYAVGILSHTGILDVFKESQASLCAAHVPELGPKCIVFSTKPEHLIRACKAAGYAEPKTFDVKAGTMMRFNAFTGAPLTVTAFEIEEWCSRAVTSRNSWAEEEGDAECETSTTVEEYKKLHNSITSDDGHVMDEEEEIEHEYGKLLHWSNLRRHGGK